MGPINHCHLSAQDTQGGQCRATFQLLPTPPSSSSLFFIPQTLSSRLVPSTVLGVGIQQCTWALPSQAGLCHDKITQRWGADWKTPGTRHTAAPPHSNPPRLLWGSGSLG